VKTVLKKYAHDAAVAFLFISTGALAACNLSASTVANTEAVTLDSSVKELTALDTLATIYATLPTCSATQAPPCSNAAYVATIQADAAKARTALEAAQAGTGPVATATALLDTVLADAAKIKAAL
jgi:hypothetical protein